MRWTLVLVMLLGCADDPAPYAPLGSNAPPPEARTVLPGLVPEDEPLPETADELWVTEASLDGDVADVSVSDVEGRVVNAYLVDGDAYFDTRADGPRGSMMHAFQIRGFSDLEPGNYSFSRDYTGELTPYATSVGCSGPADGVWDADIPGEQIDIEVRGVGDSRLVTVTSRLEAYYGPSQTITTRIRVTNAEEVAP